MNDLPHTQITVETICSLRQRAAISGQHYIAAVLSSLAGAMVSGDADRLARHVVAWSESEIERLQEKG
jgi:hypothetical protein